MGRHHTKTVVVVEVVDVVVADGATGVPLIVDEGTTTQRAALIGQPCRPKAACSLYSRPYK